MKRFILNAVVMMATIVFFTPMVYGTGLMMAPSKEGADPTAILLVEQGIKFNEENKREEALTSFELASQIDPRITVSYFNAGIALWEMGRMAEALSYLEEFGARNPGDPTGQRVLSDLKKAYFGSHPATGLGGLAEFGVASLAGFMFIFAMAALDIGTAQSIGAVKEEAFEEREWLEERWEKVA